MVQCVDTTRVPYDVSPAVSTKCFDVVPLLSLTECSVLSICMVAVLRLSEYPAG